MRILAMVVVCSVLLLSVAGCGAGEPSSTGAELKGTAKDLADAREELRKKDAEIALLRDGNKGKVVVISKTDPGTPPAVASATGSFKPNVPDREATLSKGDAIPANPRQTHLWLKSNGDLFRYSRENQWTLCRMGGNWVDGLVPYRIIWTSPSMDAGTVQELTVDGEGFKWVGKKNLKKGEE